MSNLDVCKVPRNFVTGMVLEMKGLDPIGPGANLRTMSKANRALGLYPKVGVAIVVVL